MTDRRTSFTAAALLIASSIVLSLLFFLGSRFNISINSLTVKFELCLFSLRYKKIEVPTSELVIDNKAAEGITLINPRKDYYAPDLRDALRFSYTMPFDADEAYLYIDCKGNEYVPVVGHDEFVWNKLIEGLKKLDEHYSAPAS